MPHLIDRVEGEAAQTAARQVPPFGPGLLRASEVAVLEIWGSSFKDPGDDWCEFKAFDAKGEVIGLKRVAGY